MLLGFVILTAFRVVGTEPLDVFFYLATIGVLNLLVMYILTNVAAVRRLQRGAHIQAVLPVLGTAVAGYVLYRNVWPVPPAPFRYFPYAVAGWLGVGLALTFVVPGLITRARQGLAVRAGAASDG
jgi:hypothetical protein